MSDSYISASLPKLRGAINYFEWSRNIREILMSHKKGRKLLGILDGTIQMPLRSNAVYVPAMNPKLESADAGDDKFKEDLNEFLDLEMQLSGTIGRAVTNEVLNLFKGETGARKRWRLLEKTFMSQISGAVCQDLIA